MSSSAGARQPTPRRGEARERILEEASALFQERGLAGVSMQQIADAVGITKAALYYHFRDKNDLFTEVARELMRQNFAGIIERAEREGPLRETLEDLVGHVLDIHENDVSWTIADDIQRHFSPEAAQEIFAGQPAILENAIRAMFQRAIDAGEMRPLDASVVSTLFIGMLMAIAHGAKDPWTKRQRRPGDEDILVDVFLHGIAAA